MTICTGQTTSPDDNRGFSLPELLVVITIIGLLAAIAIPQYTAHIRRAKLTDGTAMMSEYRVRLEQYFQDNRNYGTAGGSCSNNTITGPLSQHFTYACTVGAAPADTYMLTGTSVAGQGLGANAGDFTYTLTQTNARSTTKYNGTSYTTKNCWLITGKEC